MRAGMYRLGRFAAGTGDRRGRRQRGRGHPDRGVARPSCSRSSAHRHARRRIPDRRAAGAPTFDFRIAAGRSTSAGCGSHSPPRRPTSARSPPNGATTPRRAAQRGDPGPAPGAPFRELVYLVVTEQEVSAVEDRVLREVALGGPDTAAGARRLVQRVMRAPAASDTTAKRAATRRWRARRGAAALDPSTMRLVPQGAAQGGLRSGRDGPATRASRPPSAASSAPRTSSFACRSPATARCCGAMTTRRSSIAASSRRADSRSSSPARRSTSTTSRGPSSGSRCSTSPWT